MSVFVWVPGQIPPDRFDSARSVAVRGGALTVLAVDAALRPDPVPAGGPAPSSRRPEPLFGYPEGAWIRAQYPGPDGETIEIKPRPVVPQVRRRARPRSR